MLKFWTSSFPYLFHSPCRVCQETILSMLESEGCMQIQIQYQQVSLLCTLMVKSAKTLPMLSSQGDTICVHPGQPRPCTPMSNQIASILMGGRGWTWVGMGGYGWTWVDAYIITRQAKCWTKKCSSSNHWFSCAHFHSPFSKYSSTDTSYNWNENKT